MPMRPLLLSLLLSAAGGMAFAQPADDPDLAGGPPPGHHHMAASEEHSHTCYRGYRSDEMDPATGRPGLHRWREVPCPGHAMAGHPPMPPGPPPRWAEPPAPPAYVVPGGETYDRDADAGPPDADQASRDERSYERHEYRSYDSDRDGPPPRWAERLAPPPPPGWDDDAPPPGYGGPPPGYDGPPPGYDGPPPGYDGPPPGPEQGQAPPSDDQRYLDWPDKNY